MGTDRTIEMLADREPPSQETLDLRARRPIEFAPEMHEASRRPLGLEPVALLCLLTGAGLVFTILLFATGTWVAGIVCLGLTLGAITLLSRAVRRVPGSRAARGLATGADRLGSWWRFAVIVVTDGGNTALDLARMRYRHRRLRRRLHNQLGPLGAAVLHGEESRIEDLKRQAAETELALEALDRDAAATVTDARRRLRRERSTMQPTQVLESAARANNPSGRAQRPR